MSVAVRRPMTMEAFLAWEEGQELRWEFDGFAPIAMTGGTAATRRSNGISRSARASVAGQPMSTYIPAI